jgi:hypothetical protein
VPSASSVPLGSQSAANYISHEEWLVRKNDKKKETTKINEMNKIRKNKEFEFGWKNTESLTSMPPSDMTVSNLNQHHDLLVNIFYFFTIFIFLNIFKYFLMIFIIYIVHVHN